MAATNEGIDQRKTKSVCVIGAGAAGLCALRHFTDRSDKFGPIVCYEQMDRVGGTWNYTEVTGTDRYGLPIHSSMYRDLRTNLPMQIMEFPDFSSNCTESFLHHSKVLQYLHYYSVHFNLLPYINFENHLTKVTRNQTDDAWLVTVRDLKTAQTSTRTFDIFILCPGRYSSPKWPKIDTLRLFNGPILHSHDYRCREPFTGQQIAVIGGGPSGIDLSLEISTVATKVILVNRTDRQYQQLPGNVQQVKGEVHAFVGNSMEVIVNRKILRFDIDSVILATGYRLNLDYLDQESCGLQLNEDDSLGGLFRHLINIKYPSMAILAVAVGAVLPFPLYHQQILYFLTLQLSQYSLPSPQQMIEQVKAEMVQLNSQGLPIKDRHLLRNADSLCQYVRSLEIDAKLKPLKPVILKLYGDILHRIQLENTVYYKAGIVRFLNDDEYLFSIK